MQAHIDCTQCANCCRYSIVSVRAAEVARIAACLGIDEEAVVRQFTTRDAESPRARTLLSGKRGCVFLKDNRCSITPRVPKPAAIFRTWRRVRIHWGAPGIVVPLGSALSGAL